MREFQGEHVVDLFTCTGQFRIILLIAFEVKVDLMLFAESEQVLLDEFPRRLLNISSSQ